MITLAWIGLGLGILGLFVNILNQSPFYIVVALIAIVLNGAAIILW